MFSDQCGILARVWVLELIELVQIPGSKFIIIVESFMKILRLCDVTGKIVRKVININRKVLTTK